MNKDFLNELKNIRNEAIEKQQTEILELIEVEKTKIQERMVEDAKRGASKTYYTFNPLSANTTVIHAIVDWAKESFPEAKLFLSTLIIDFIGEEPIEDILVPEAKELVEDEASEPVKEITHEQDIPEEGDLDKAVITE